MRRRKYKALLGWLLSALVLAVCLSPQARSFFSLPSLIRVTEGVDFSLPLELPFGVDLSLNEADLFKVNGTEVGPLMRRFSLAEPLSFRPLRPGKAELSLSLFGITIRRLSLQVLPSVSLVAAGHSVGVSLRSQGVLVVGFATIENEAGAFSPGREAGLRVGDQIMALNGHTGLDGATIARLVDQYGRQNQEIELSVKRGTAELTLRAVPRSCRETGQQRIGVFVRDTAVGIGTLTFVDRESMTFGALGHVIADADTGDPIALGSGRIVRATVTFIEAGRRGAPGEKRSVFVDEQRTLGTVKKNTPFGIFGHMLEDITAGTTPIPIMLRDEVEEGPAEILTVIAGEQVERFAIEIQRVSRLQHAPLGKGLVIRATDPRLLQKTGGIVQGMSGSPIVQRGRLVGAVTHVFVNDPARGYGVFIEWMIRESDLLERREEHAPTFFYRRFFRAS
jgi:stage IV sporulation protein B